jgi:hypothetical protein
MHVRLIALALPLALGIACSHTRSKESASSAPPQTGEQTATAPTDAAAPGTTTGSAAPAPSRTDVPQGTDTAPDANVAGAPPQPGTDTGTSSPTASAEDPIIEQGDPVKAHAEDSVVSGKIARVARRFLVIQSDSGDQSTLFIVPETTIQVDGQDAHRSDLKEGQDVRASFDEQDGHYVAVKIRASAGAKATSPDAPGH